MVEAEDIPNGGGDRGLNSTLSGDLAYCRNAPDYPTLVTFEVTMAHIDHQRTCG